MKAIAEPESQTRANAWGQGHTTTKQRFEIEASDVGQKIHNWGGYQYKSLTVTHRDVGKVVEQLTDGSGWTCWGFVA